MIQKQTICIIAINQDMASGLRYIAANLNKFTDNIFHNMLLFSKQVNDRIFHSRQSLSIFN
jgi:hypothetical protein